MRHLARRSKMRLIVNGKEICILPRSGIAPLSLDHVQYSRRLPRDSLKAEPSAGRGFKCTTMLHAQERVLAALIALLETAGVNWVY